MKTKFSKPNALLLVASVSIVLAIAVVSAWQVLPSSVAANEESRTQSTAASPEESKPTFTKKHKELVETSQRIRKKQETEIRPVIVSPKVEASKQKWLEIRPIFQNYYDQQIETVVSGIEALNSDLVDMANGIDTTAFAEALLGLDAFGQTIGSFADKLFGLEGTSDAFKDERKIKRFLRDLFAEHVFNLEDLERIIHQRIGELNQEFIALDNELLISCDLDVDFDPAAIGLQQIDLGDLHDHFAKNLPALESMLEKAFATNVTATATGLAAGLVGENIGSRFGRDEQGNETLMSFIFGMAGGIAADYAADELTRQTLQAKLAIIHDSHEIALRIMRSLIISENHTPQWQNPTASHCGSHIGACIKIISTELAIDPQPMLDIVNTKN